MTCSHCHHMNPADARFCTGCGQALALLCPACQTPNTLDSRFCKACGTLLLTSDALPPAQRATPSPSYTPRHLADKILAMRSALEGERKQVTVLFADVVGFSTLAGPLDPEDVHTLMDGCFEILTQQVHRYEGTINQFTGDGIMALFGAPLMHEDHAVRALRAGEEFSDPSVISFATWVLSWAYTARGDLVQALAYAELGVQNALTPADKNWVQSLLGWAWGRAGEPRKGVELLAAALALNRSGRPADKVGVQSAHVPAEIFQMLFLGEAYWLASESDNARKTLAELLELANRCGAKFYLGSAHRLLGEIALTTNPIQVAAPLAVPHFEQSIAILQEIKAENELALAYAGYGRLHQQQGNMAQAREYLTRALTIFERLGTLGEPDKVRRALAALPSA